MGKQKRQKKPSHRHSLEHVLENPATYGVRAYPRRKSGNKRGRDDDEEEKEEAALPSKVSARILKQARQQQEEVELEDEERDDHEGGGKVKIGRGALSAALQRLADSDDDDDDDDHDSLMAPDEYDDEEAAGGYLGGGDILRGLGLCDGDNAGLHAEDEAALAAFMAPAAAAAAAAAGGQPPPSSLSLGDLILAKLQEKKQQSAAAVEEGGGGGGGAGSKRSVPSVSLPPSSSSLEPKVVAVYRGVGGLLSRYTSGKLPKAFKIIPNLSAWEEVLGLTDPLAWSPAAVYQATRLFMAALNARLAQRYLTAVLLPRVRRDIQQDHKLHFAVFQALKKATFKPAAFFKGILLPLASSGSVTLREAVVLSSVISRVSLPALHAAAALLRLADMPYCGTTSFFIRVLLDKKYALPQRVIAALTAHFVSFSTDGRVLPVVWHQTLLCFVQRYKLELSAGQRSELRDLCRAQSHYRVTPEVIRELDAADQAAAAAVAAAAAGGGSRGQQSVAVFMSSGGYYHQQQQQQQMGRHVVEDVRNMPPVPMMDD